MLKFLHTDLCAFDVEWVPDPVAGRRRYHLPDAMVDADVMAQMYLKDRAYHPETNPTPYLRTPLCRIVSVAVARWTRGVHEGAVVHSWAGADEARIIGSFMRFVGKHKPQLFSYNGQRADLPILMQRGALRRVAGGAFLSRPAKPWDGVDYFDRYSGWHVDLLDSAIGGGSLADMCAGLDIPGKGAVDGGEVAALWAAGDIEALRLYNEADAMRVLAIVARVGYMRAEVIDSPPWSAAVLSRHPEWAAQGAA